MNGCYVVQGNEMGIGMGKGRTVQNIVILDGLITTKGGTGAGIGTGFSSTVNRHEIHGGKGNAESVLGPGIVSKSASVSGHQSRIDTTQIWSANMRANPLNSSRIGSRHAAGHIID
jgi:hypothetical protein